MCVWFLIGPFWFESLLLSWSRSFCRYDKQRRNVLTKNCETSPLITRQHEKLGNTCFTCEWRYILPGPNVLWIWSTYAGFLRWFLVFIYFFVRLSRFLTKRDSFILGKNNGTEHWSIKFQLNTQLLVVIDLRSWLSRFLSIYNQNKRGDALLAEKKCKTTLFRSYGYPSWLLYFHTSNNSWEFCNPS